MRQTGSVFAPETMSITDENAGRDGRRVTLVGVLVNALLAGLKFLGGFFGRSQALIADAIHSVSDLFTDAVVLVGLRVGRKAPDVEHPFGHARLETLASAVVGLALLAVSVEIAAGAIQTISDHSAGQPSWLAVIVAGLSIVSKEALYQYTAVVGGRIKSPVVRANAWHHRSDALSSVAVLMGVAGAQIKPEWHILDAYAALLVSIFVLKAGLDIILKCVREFTDTAPDPEVLGRISTCALGVPGVLDVHDLKVRSAGGLYQMEIHIVVDGRLSVTEGHHIAKEVEDCVIEEVEDAGQVIVHVDPDE